ncbi:hypothetical protein [Parasphingorhabdus sp.]|uniref:hypothetical protein n=1 Tax=Parasphingorhabdus sp. TaxID=2709688 RepID=UPI003C78F14E
MAMKLAYHQKKTSRIADHFSWGTMTRFVNFSILLIFLSGALTGCTTINMVQQDGVAATAYQQSTHIGITRLRLPASQGNVQAADIKTLGVGWQSGPFIGWNASNLVTADPSECQLLIVVRSAAQAENAAKIISSLEGQDPCIVDYTEK